VPEDLSLFKNMQQGDVSALEYFFREYADFLYYRALGYVHHSQVAEDVVQEVFIRFWDNRAKLDISTSVAAYLTRSVVNSVKTIWNTGVYGIDMSRNFSLKTLKRRKCKGLTRKNWNVCGRGFGYL